MKGRHFLTIAGLLLIATGCARREFRATLKRDLPAHLNSEAGFCNCGIDIDTCQRILSSSHGWSTYVVPNLKVPISDEVKIRKSIKIHLVSSGVEITITGSSPSSSSLVVEAVASGFRAVLRDYFPGKSGP